MRLQRELKGHPPQEIARLMVAYPGLDHREVAERVSELQQDARWHPDRVGVAALGDADRFQLEFRLNDRGRASAEHDRRTPDQRAADIAQHTAEIRAVINYAGDGPPELTAALDTQIGFEARFRDLRGVEQRVEAEQAPARMLARAEHEAYAEKPARDAAIADKAAEAAWGAERSRPSTPRSAAADTEEALRVATPPAAKEASAQPTAQEDPNVRRLREQRMASWTQFARDHGYKGP